MSACMKRNSELLKVLAKCKPNLRQAILKAAEDDLFEAIRQCLLNVWLETVNRKHGLTETKNSEETCSTFWAYQICSR